MKRLPLLLLALVSLLPVTGWSQAKTNPFEKEIIAFEARDKTNPPPKNAILFLGSSSIRMWKTVAADLPEYSVINRGFGGSQISDSIHYADRIIYPYEPSVVVFYAGGNDIHAGKSPETVFADYQTLVQRVHAKLPKTRLAYIAISGNPSRWSEIERVRTVNRLIENYSKTDPRLSYIDTHSLMLTPDGTPKPDIFLKDRLHMNEKGYAIWTDAVRKHLQQLGAEKKRP